MLFTSNSDRLSVVFDACALRDDERRLTPGLIDGDDAHFRVFGVGTRQDDRRTIGTHSGREPHGVVRLFVDEVVFGALPDIVHVHAPGAPGVIRYHVDELAGVIDEEGTRRNVGDGVFEEGTGFQIEETLLVAFVTLLVYGDAQQLAATGRLEATKGEKLHVFGVLVAVEDDDLTLKDLAGLDGRRGVAHDLITLVEGGVAVEDGVLAAGHHAAVVPPVADAVRDGQVR